MTTGKPFDPFENHPFPALLERLLPPRTSPVRQALVDAMGVVSNEMAHGRQVDRATALRICSNILGALAQHADGMPALPLSAHGTTTLTGSASITVAKPPTVVTKANIFTPAVHILSENRANDALMVEQLPAEGLSHSAKVMLIKAQIFLVVFFTLYGVVSAREDQADTLTLYTGGGVIPIAWWCAQAVARQYDKKFGDNPDE